ncbi:hypothetical protein F5X99DRAFT_52113 [Biscogniauxia marginata]|nr:hypothetical protein F5X99DRAFT_52113 [Biscogniauxia marginata]
MADLDLPQPDYKALSDSLNTAAVQVARLPNIPMVQNEDRMQEVLTALKGITASQTEMKSDMQMMKSDMQTMKSDMQTMKSDMQTMKSDTQTMKTEIQKVQTDMQKMQDKMNQGFTEVNKRFTDVDKRFTNMEKRSAAANANTFARMANFSFARAAQTPLQPLRAIMTNKPISSFPATAEGINQLNSKQIDAILRALEEEPRAGEQLAQKRERLKVLTGVVYHLE